MSKRTNLSMVQNILSAMDSDSVNSISDTEEASQIETILEEVYYNITSRRKWSFMEKTLQLENAVDLERPTKLVIPEQVSRINCLRYKTYKVDTDPQEYSWKELKYLLPCDFIDHVQSRNITQLESEGRAITVLNDDSVEMYTITDTEPEFWTSFDDKNLYLDNWVLADSNTVIGNRTSVKAIVQPVFVKGDTEIQDLPPEMFPLLLAEAKSTAWLNFKGDANAKAEQVASRQYVKMREEEPTVQAPRTWINYGKPPSGSRVRSSRRGMSYYL